MVIRVQKARELENEIAGLAGDYAEVYVNIRPTEEIIKTLQTKFPSLEKIACPKSLYAQTAKKVFKYVGDANLRLEPGDFEVGRPPKYDEATIREINTQRVTGKSARQISREMDIPLRTVYFYLAK